MLRFVWHVCNVAPMAIKTLTVATSDISSKELTDETHTRIVVRHPDHTSALEIDASADEANKLQSTAMRLVEFEIYEPNKPMRKAVVETKTLDKLFGAGVNFDQVLEGARKAAKDAAPVHRARGTAPKGDKVDYTAADQYGKLHRGRVTDEEAKLVKANREQASKNRQAQGHPAIDFASDAEKKRYGIS